jgi:hypothetical protein
MGAENKGLGFWQENYLERMTRQPSKCGIAGLLAHEKNNGLLSRLIATVNMFDRGHINSDVFCQRQKTTPQPKDVSPASFFAIALS